MVMNLIEGMVSEALKAFIMLPEIIMKIMVYLITNPIICFIIVVVSITVIGIYHYFTKHVEIIIRRRKQEKIEKIEIKEKEIVQIKRPYKGDNLVIAAIETIFDEKPVMYKSFNYANKGNTFVIKNI